jgi:Leucine Rich repeat
MVDKSCGRQVAFHHQRLFSYLGYIGCLEALRRESGCFFSRIRTATAASARGSADRVARRVLSAIQDDKEALNRWRQKIGPEEAKQMANELVINTTLRRFDLSYNRIGGAGMEALGQALRRDRSLQSLTGAGTSLPWSD